MEFCNIRFDESFLSGVEYDCGFTGGCNDINYGEKNCHKQKAVVDTLQLRSSNKVKLEPVSTKKINNKPVKRFW